MYLRGEQAVQNKQKPIVLWKLILKFVGLNK